MPQAAIPGVETETPSADACANGLQDQGEEGPDCGGLCGLACVEAVAPEDEIVAPVESCLDGLQNQGETAPDCGGPNCARCADGAGCLAASDCQSGVCSDGDCGAPACDDSVKNQNETGVDCGGDCGPCQNGDGCELNGDCLSDICSDATCIDITCTDGVLSAPETGVDCGGPECAACAAGEACAEASDCQSTVCSANVCAEPSCVDGILNQNETDLDCGGDCPGCPVGQVCRVSGDCDSNVCFNETCREAGCVIQGAYYSANSENPNNDCEVCEPSSDGAGWTPRLQGASCADGLVCTRDSCDGAGQCVGTAEAATCVVGGVCYENGDLSGANASLYCNPQLSQEAFSAADCEDGYQNQGEPFVDSGGPCPIRALYCDRGSDPWTVSLYTFENLASRTAEDVTSLNSGVFVGGSGTASQSLNGCGDALATNSTVYAQVDHSASLALSEGSIDAFVRTPDRVMSLLSAAVAVKHAAAASPDGQISLLITDEGRVVVQLRDQNVDYFRCSNQVYDPGAWIHVGVNFGSPDLELHINGEKQNYAGDVIIDGDTISAACGGRAVTQGLQNNTVDLLFGALMETGGRVDSVRVSDARREFSSLREDCGNGARDRSETDVDCGGVCGPSCAVNESCNSGSDCAAGVCGGGRCLPATCEDQVENGNEIATDCGGGCGPCNVCGSYSGADFCSSFEDASYPEWDSVSLGGRGAVLGSPARSYRGENSLRVQAVEGADQATLVLNDVGNISTGDVYIRFYMYVLPGALYDPGATRHVFRYANGGTDYAGLGFNIKGGDRFELTVSNHGAASFPTTPAGSIVEERWVCVRYHASLASANGVVEVEVDGTNYRFSGYDTLPLSAAYRELLFGMPLNYLDIQRASILFDDLVIDRSPVPCD